MMILEAMKMENMLKSPGDGVVKEVKVKQGDSVEKNQLSVVFESTSSSCSGGFFMPELCHFKPEAKRDKGNQY